MKTTKKLLALLLALTLLLTFTACGKDDDSDKGDGGETTTTTTTVPTTGTTDGGLLPADEPDGSAEHPFEIGGQLEFDAVVKAGGVTHYDVYRVDGTILSIASKDVTVEYEGKTYEPKNGVVSFPVSSDDITLPVKLAIRNKGAADATFKVTFAYPEGTKSNPITLSEGELVIELKAGDEDGLVYLFTATEKGTLTVVDNSVTKGDPYDISLFNLSNSASRTLGEDGVEKEGKKSVSVQVSKGDKVEVTFAALLNNKNEYPAVTLKTLIAFSKEGNSDKPVEKWLDYTVTVKDQDGKPVPGVNINISCEMIAKTVTTDSKGVAKANLPEGVPTGTIEVPKGYIAASKNLSFKEGETSLSIVLEKEQPIAPPPPPADPEVTTMDYTVTLQDGNGAPMGGMTVVFYSGDKQVAKQAGDKKGVSKVTLDRGTYTVKVEGTKLFYDEKAAVVSVNKANITLTLAAEIDTSKTLKINDPLIDKMIKVPYLSEGAAYVSLAAGERNYFLFEPTRDGTYRFSSSNTYAKIGYYGGSDFVMTFNLAADTTSGNAFNISVNETQIGNIFVIGIDAATNCDAAVLLVTRIGDPAWSIEDEPTVEYKGDGAPKAVTAPSGLTNLDIFSATQHHLVYSDKDGYYHLDSASGPVVYVQMDSPSASIVGLLEEFGNMTAYLYNADGSFKAKEQYAVLMQQYVDKMDKTQKVYPLTKDLKYMLDNYGNSQNWWNEGEPGYLFEEVEGVNPANAWMFLYCYKK
ncbi:MAG: Ig-like domain-containing protein [Clostridia bacterium]|nr:Ig-like domain-containing protein [Clostridia bacterium]